MSKKFPKPSPKSANTVEFLDRMANSPRQIRTTGEAIRGFDTPENTCPEAGHSTSAPEHQRGDENDDGQNCAADSTARRVINSATQDTKDVETGHQVPKDRVADHPEAFVSSKKKEMYQDPGLDGCGEKSSTQEVGEYPMDDFEILDAMIRLAKPSDRDALRKLRFLCRNSSKTLSGFAAMSESELTSALRKTPCTRNGMAAKKPSMFARKIPRVIADLAAQYPEKGFPLFIPPSEKPKIPVAAEADWPLAFIPSL